jgi:WD40 repeat protein
MITKPIQLYDARTLEVIKSYQDAQTPLNSSALIPGKPYILVGGGQEAMAVTTTSARQGNFEIRMWHVVFEEEVSRIKGGFGPCNSIAVHPEGKGYAIGGEDGYVRLHHFDENTFRAKRQHFNNFSLFLLSIRSPCVLEQVNDHLLVLVHNVTFAAHTCSPNRNFSLRS